MVQDEDWAYLEAMLIDLPKRALLHPEALFKQLSSLEMGPLVTQAAGDDLDANPEFQELSSKFVPL